MRGSELLHQFYEEHRPQAERILSGALLVVWGLLKKVFVADLMGRIVESVYGTAAAPLDPAAFSGGALLMATYAFAVQIYCDFSAYTDICIGSGRILGFRIIENFNSPYLAVSITEFWRRWHMSLSRWLRDYLYIPLGGNRLSSARTYLNLMITMLLGGLWHGASWTFVAWGGLHGLFLAVERLLGLDHLDRSRLTSGRRWLRGIFTFHLVCLSWVLFRSPTFLHAVRVVGRILTWAEGSRMSLAPLACVIAIVALQTAKLKINFHMIFMRRPTLARWTVYACIGLLFVALTTTSSHPFIYFQF
jgi:D-alanyl-lipoteichoic acid acyltransferase DltB (MBOAT superfamily)